MSGFFKSVDVAVRAGESMTRCCARTKKVLFPSMAIYVFSTKRTDSESVTFVSGDVGEWTRAIQSKPGKISGWLVK
jgi:hypothetical protein